MTNQYVESQVVYPAKRIMQDLGLDTAAPIKTIFNENKEDKS